MSSDNRRTIILKELEDGGPVTVVDLASRLGVSEMTIRRDLADLEKEGGIRRIHGGAVNARGRSYEPPLALRENENQPAKRKIGKAAASLIADGESIALDIGSTTLQIARNLVGRHNLTVLTSSLHIANLLYSQPDIRLILSGGMVRLGEASLIGDLARYAYQNLYVDRLFLGVGAIDAQSGLTEYNWEDALVKQAMIGSAKEVILVADASKFDRVAFARVASLNNVHQIVTDRAPTGELLEAFNRIGIFIHVAGQEDGLPADPREEK
jgi:DeoR family transcriptional regulator, fructose operon transcriptional repressor